GMIFSANDSGTFTLTTCFSAPFDTRTCKYFSAPAPNAAVARRHTTAPACKNLFIFLDSFQLNRCPYVRTPLRKSSSAEGIFRSFPRQALAQRLATPQQAAKWGSEDYSESRCNLKYSAPSGGKVTFSENGWLFHPSGSE